MIKEILKLMSKGDLTLSQISHELKISRKELTNKLAMMEHMKYIETIDENKSNIENTCEDCTLFHGDCSGEKTLKVCILGYRITAKGRRVLGGD